MQEKWGIYTSTWSEMSGRRGMGETKSNVNKLSNKKPIVLHQKPSKEDYGCSHKLAALFLSCSPINLHKLNNKTCLLFDFPALSRLLWFPEDGHSLSRLDTQADCFINTALWLQQHLWTQTHPEAAVHMTVCQQGQKKGFMVSSTRLFTTVLLYVKKCAKILTKNSTNVEK